MSILCWDKPEKIMTKEQYKNSYIADGAPPGVYASNMSDENKLKWKAKYISGANERVEIRKTTVNGVQMVIIVWEAGDMKLSANGTINTNFFTFKKVIEEALERLVYENA